MKVIAIEFRGSCASCDNDPSKVRGGVEIAPSNNTELICLVCAKRLAKRLLKAVDFCRSKRRAGMMYRSDRWQTKVAGARR
jgi:hypothetical protein